MNNAYDKNGNPVNLVCTMHVFPENFDTAHCVHFVKLPKVKYFAENTWCLTNLGGDNGNTWAQLLPKRQASSRGVQVSFSDLSPKFQSFVMQYYEDTFGLPGEGIEE